MANQNMKALIEFTISQMKAEFANSKKIFEDDKSKNSLIHSGEFGVYRERIVAQFLKLILPPTYEIGSGFIITPNNEHSTQCDILIYDKDSTTLFTDQANARLFPVETVVGFCEVKSNIQSLSELKKIIDKMHDVTKLRHNMDKTEGINPETSKTRLNSNGRNVFKMIEDFFKTNEEAAFLDKSCLDSMYYNKNLLDHNMMSLLICNKIEVTNIDDMLDELQAHYKQINFAPCAILSLQDGVILHINSQKNFNGYFLNSNLPELIPLNTRLKLFDINNIDGLMKFINIIRQTVIATKTYEFDIVKYIQNYYR